MIHPAGVLQRENGAVFIHVLTAASSFCKGLQSLFKAPVRQTHTHMWLVRARGHVVGAGCCCMCQGSAPLIHIDSWCGEKTVVSISRCSRVRVSFWQLLGVSVCESIDREPRGRLGIWALGNIQPASCSRWDKQREGRRGGGEKAVNPKFYGLSVDQ